MKKVLFIFSFVSIFIILPFIFKIYAARLTPIQDIMSNNTVSTVANNNFVFSANGGLPANATVTITFPTGFSNINVSSATSNLTGSTFSITSNTITMSTTTAVEIPGYSVNINNIYATNPSSPSSTSTQYIINISDSAGDSAGVGVVIIPYSQYGSGPAGDQYQQAITINNTSNTSTLTNYQIQITLNTSSLITAGQMQSDCADIRFTDSSGNLLPYWIESGCNTTTTLIWVNVDTITASTDTTINLYYGSSSASPQSNGHTTFPFFDNFANSTLNTSTWTSSGGSSCYSLSSGKLVITCGSIYTNSTIGTQPNLITEANVSWGSTTGNYSGLMIANAQGTQGSNGGSNKLVYYMTNSNSSSVVSWAANGTSNTYNIVSDGSLFTETPNTNYIIGDLVTPTQVNFYNNRTEVSSYTGTWSGAYYLYLGYFEGSSLGGLSINPLTVSWVLTRQYTPTSPSISIASSVTDLTNNQVELTLNVSPYIIFGISSNTLDLGLISYINPISQTNSLSISTNAEYGVNITVDDEYSGLYSSANSYTIPSTTETLASGSQGFGINASSSLLTILYPYNSIGNGVGGLSSSYNTSLASSTGPVQNGLVNINYVASASSTTPTGVYDDNITYIASGNF